MNSQESLPENVFVRRGPQKGPSVAIFAGIHGDERVGIEAIREILPKLQVTRGTLYVAFANPPAIEKGIRMVNKNLNRCFYSGNKGTTYEDQRARDLMSILDRCVALLDLHAYDDISGDPFTICEENSLDLAVKLEPPIVSTNWTNTEPGGTDAYMYLCGKVGLCVECGHVNEPAKYLDLAKTTILQFLRYYNMVDDKIKFSKEAKKLIRTEKGLIRTSENFWLDPSLRSFDRLQAGQKYCSQDGKDFIAEEGEYIIFPKSDPKINTEAFVVGRELQIPSNILVNSQ